MDEKQIKMKITQGFLHIRAIVEIVGKPEDYVKTALKDHLKKIEDDFEVLKKTIEPPKEHESYFSTFAEIEILVKDTNDLLSFTFDYLPSSIEILDPESIMINTNDFSDFLNDLQSRLLALNSGIIQAKDLSKHYIKNSAVLLRNFLVMLLSSGAKTLIQLQSFMGVKPVDIEKILNILINEKKVKQDNDLYSLIVQK